MTVRGSRVAAEYASDTLAGARRADLRERVEEIDERRVASRFHELLWRGTGVVARAHASALAHEHLEALEMAGRGPAAATCSGVSPLPLDLRPSILSMP